MGKYDHINFKPPAGVRKEAAKGLEWRKEFGRGGTAIGVARARDLKNGVTISPRTAKRMKAFFDRHQVNKKAEGWSPGEKGFPSNGRIAWALWGSDAGWSWSKKLVKQINAADERNTEMPESIERRAFFDEEKSESPLLKVESRAAGEGEEETRWIVGYAAKFNVDSLDMGEFTERIAPGAFGIVSERRGRKTPLETRALWNHDPNYPLARYPTNLRMHVDDVGLRYEFPVPDTTYGRDLANNIEAGIVRGSSFSFVVANGGESWDVVEGKNVRMINSISELYDVGPVTYPAYPDATSGIAKRSFDEFMAKKNEECEVRKKLKSTSDEIKDFLRDRGCEVR